MKAIKSLSVTSVIVFSLYLCACGASTDDSSPTVNGQETNAFSDSPDTINEDVGLSRGCTIIRITG